MSRSHSAKAGRPRRHGVRCADGRVRRRCVECGGLRAALTAGGVCQSCLIRSVPDTARHHESSLASDERIAELAARAAAELPLFPARRCDPPRVFRPEIYFWPRGHTVGLL